MGRGFRYSGDVVVSGLFFSSLEISPRNPPILVSAVFIPLSTPPPIEFIAFSNTLSVSDKDACMLVLPVRCSTPATMSPTICRSFAPIPSVPSLSKLSGPAIYAAAVFRGSRPYLSDNPS